MSGGYQSGAYLLAGSDRESAVLKWSADPEQLEPVLSRAPIVAEVRDRGWPTPAWLAVGQTTTGGPYEIQEYVEGHIQETVDDAWLDAVLPVVAGQAGLATADMWDIAREDAEIVFADAIGHWTAVSGSGAAGAELTRTIAELTAPYRSVVLPSDDLVHGDLNPENVVIRPDGRVALVDVESLGRGTRLHDLCTLLLYATSWGESAVIDRLVAECRRVAGPGHFPISLAAVALGLLAFGVWNWPADDLAAICRTTTELLGRVLS